MEDINSGTILSYDALCAGPPVITLQKSKQIIIVSMWNGKDTEIPSLEGCIQSLDWTSGLDWWTGLRYFPFLNQIFGQLVASMLVSCS